MAVCETTDFMYPMKADIYYPVITQNDYGHPKKEWIFDRTVAINATSVGGVGEEQIKPAEFLQHENKLVARTKSDIRISSSKDKNAMTNILVTNIRDIVGEIIYKETAGPRSGKSTIYEIATVDPFVNPFGSIEFYKIVLRRTENQAVEE